VLTAGPMYTTDSAQSWTEATGIMAGGGRIKLAYALSNPNVVYASVSGPADPGMEWQESRLYRSSARSGATRTEEATRSSRPSRSGGSFGNRVHGPFCSA
jgi:hypothetical protein